MGGGQEHSLYCYARGKGILQKASSPPRSKSKCHKEMSPFHINSRTRSIPEPPQQSIYSRGLPSPPCFDCFTLQHKQARYFGSPSRSRELPKGGSLSDTTFNFNYHFQLHSWQSSLPQLFAGWLHNQPRAKWQQASGASKDGSQPFETQKTNIYREDRKLCTLLFHLFFLLYSHTLSIVPRDYS